METGFYYIRLKSIEGWTIGYYNMDTDRWNVPELKTSIASKFATKITQPIPCSPLPINILNYNTIVEFINKSYTSHGIGTTVRDKSNQDILFIRIAIVYCLRHYSNFSFYEIGEFVNKHQATVVYSIKRHHYYLQKNIRYKIIFESVKSIYHACHSK